MKSKWIVEFSVGLFIIFGFIAVFLLALRVSGLDLYSVDGAYAVTATFENVGDLKVRAPVKMAGVRIGEISNISLDKANYQAKVTMLIDRRDNNIPDDSSASILSASLLGSNYVSITPGFSEQVLKNNGKITETHSAIILENLLGQAIFKQKKSNNNK